MGLQDLLKAINSGSFISKIENFVCTICAEYFGIYTTGLHLLTFLFAEPRPPFAADPFLPEELFDELPREELFELFEPLELFKPLETFNP